MKKIFLSLFSLIVCTSLQAYNSFECQDMYNTEIVMKINLSISETSKTVNDLSISMKSHTTYPPSDIEAEDQVPVSIALVSLFKNEHLAIREMWYPTVIRITNSFEVKTNLGVVLYTSVAKFGTHLSIGQKIYHMTCDASTKL